MEQTIGSYKVVRLLGRGGMGSVYEVRHTAIERRAAIKLLHKDLCTDPDVLKRFVNEARAVNIIGHSGLVGVSEFGQTEDGLPYIVMDYIEGVTLREHIQKSGGRLPVEQVVHLSQQIASTLAAAHAKQIVHRDLKPVNIMLVADPESGTEWRVKVLDFGIAKLSFEQGSQTKSGVLMGTPTYMSPEQCRSGRNAVDRSDVYALGVIMYELLAGETPFRGGPAVMMAMHVSTPPEPLAARAPGTPPALCELIHRMLAKNPSDRPSAHEVAQSLTAVDGKVPLLAPPLVLEPATRPGSQSAIQVSGSPSPAGAGLLRGSMLGVIAAGVLVVGGGGLLALLVATSRPAKPSLADMNSRLDVGVPDALPPVAAEHPAPATPDPLPDPAPHSPHGGASPHRAGSGHGKGKHGAGSGGAHHGAKAPGARSGPHHSTR